MKTNYQTEDRVIPIVDIPTDEELTERFNALFV